MIIVVIHRVAIVTNARHHFMLSTLTAKCRHFLFCCLSSCIEPYNSIHRLLCVIFDQKMTQLRNEFLVIQKDIRKTDDPELKSVYVKNDKSPDQLHENF